jgi:hypothetical protein
MRRGAALLVLLVSLALACDGGDPASPATASPSTASRDASEPNASLARNELVADADVGHGEPGEPYDRKLWKHWIDADHDCQDARVEVLIAESYGEVEFEDARGCEPASGEWQCPYTGKLLRESHLLDVDHLVPLANAHRSGGGAWSAERRMDYANDLSQPYHLIAVDYAANRSKGDKGPEAWLPPSEEFRCTYVREWVAVKARWGLGMSDAETTAIAEATRVCNDGGVPELPQARNEPNKTPTKPRPQPTARPDAPEAAPDECCRTCKKGKACGDGCIAREAECSEPPGCACNAA